MRKNTTAILAALLILSFAASAVTAFIQTTQAATTGWTLVTNGQGLKAYPNLLEYVWQKNATMAPNGPYDMIGLHRLIKANTTLKGVVLIATCPSWGSGEQLLSNPPTDNYTKYENSSQPIYWANRGFDVYAIDYRPHFVPKTLNASQMNFTANWGWDVWVSDTKEAADQVKAVSGTSKFFIAGDCTGGESALNYGTKFWKDDLLGIILLDSNNPPLVGYPIVGRVNETNTFNVTKAIADMNLNGNWTFDQYRTLRPVAIYALQNPGAPAEYPPGTPLTPATNPVTNKTWTNITEWFTFMVQNIFGTGALPAGAISNLTGGYGNIAADEYSLGYSELLPLRLFIENQAMADWVNCPNLSYDYNDHYNEIGVPLLAFSTQTFTNRTGTFRYVNGINNTDFTGIMLKNYGHLDVYFGTNSSAEVSEPAYQWMLSHAPVVQPSPTPSPTPIIPSTSLSASAFTSVSVMKGQAWYFFTQALGGAGPYKMQWYENGAAIAGQTDMVLITTKATAGTYTYYCIVTDAQGKTATTNTVTLTVQ